MKYHFYLYEIRNNINGKVYVGVHKTRNLDDGYMGSGIHIKRAIKQHGIENFTKTILKQYDSSEEMYAGESQIVDSNFILRDDVYNICEGGLGGETMQKLAQERLAHLRENDPDWVERNKKSLRDSYANGRIPNFSKEVNAKLRVRAWSDSARAKRKESIQRNASKKGSKNPQFGKTWVWHELFGNKSVQKNSVIEYYDQGWIWYRIIPKNGCDERSRNELRTPGQCRAAPPEAY